MMMEKIKNDKAIIINILRIIAYHCLKTLRIQPKTS